MAKSSGSPSPIIQRKLRQWGEVGLAHRDSDSSSDRSADESKEKRVGPLVKKNLDAEKRKYVLREMLQTEQEYVRKLANICQVVLPHAKEAKYIPPALAGKMGVVFGNIGAIYEFHRDILLPDMEKTLRGEGKGCLCQTNW